MIGDGIVRTDGVLKVTGTAPYSLERKEPGRALCGVIRGAAIGSGRIVSIDTEAAERAPGVRLVWTHRNAPAQSEPLPYGDLTGPRPVLTGERVEHYGEPVAFVVAESLEEARAAAALVSITYEAAPAAYELVDGPDDAGWYDEIRAGDVDVAMTTAMATLSERYSTPYHFGQPMEPNACLASWSDGHLTVYLAAQMISQLVEGLAETLRLDQQQITVDSAFVGGGFGSKIGLHAEAVLASLATMALNQPVKLQLTRRQLFTIVGHRAASLSHVRLAAGQDGQLTAIGHDATVQTSREDHWRENVAAVSRALYAAPNRLTRHARRELAVGPAEPVRGPGEVAGLLVFESAMDELAVKLGMDPVELRLRNDTAFEPDRKVPLSGRRLADCLRDGAARFGWEARPQVPGSRRDGEWLIGFGVAASIRGHFQTFAEVSVRLDPEGVVIVKSDMTDLGTGTYTIVAQVAAAALGVPIDRVRVQLARTDHPASMGSGGSWGAANVSVATDRACVALLEQVRAVAGVGYNDLFAELRRHFPDGLEASGRTLESRDDPNYQSHAQYTYGASFAEVGVNAYTGEVRLRRMLGVFSAGRILNARTARSQLIGGMIWGVSAALHEGAYPDPRFGNWPNGDLAEYLLPVHADIPDIEAVMLDDFDDKANHLGVKGIGELGAGGTGASVANAVFNASGVRIRDFPITIAKVLPGLAALG